VNFYVPSDEIERLSRESLQERAADIARQAQKHLAEFDATLKVASVVATHHDRVILLSEEGEAISVPYETAGAALSFGLPAKIAVRRYTDLNRDTWVLDEATAIADLVLSGDKAQVRNRLRGLAESIAPGGAYTTEAILKRLAEGLTRRGSWADVYAEKAREIRAAIHGKIGSIQESLPSARFGALASRHAPEDPERFRSRLNTSLDEVLSAYDGIATRMSVADPSGARGLDRFIGLAESALLQNLSGFVNSLRSSAEAVAKDGRQVLTIQAESGDIPTLARLHDLLAEGLEDFAVCATFVEQLLGAVKNTPGGTQS
jgi:hypothetical protein